MGDKSREYEEFLKQFEKEQSPRSDSDRQRQPVNNRTYTRQHIPQRRRTAKKRKQRRLLGISAAVLAIIILLVLIIIVAKSCSSGGEGTISGTYELTKTNDG